MQATFDIGTKNLELCGIGDAAKINEIRKGMGWKLIRLEVMICEPVRCAICGKVVAVIATIDDDEEDLTYPIIRAEYGYKTLDGEERAVCCDCWNHEEGYYLSEEQIAQEVL